MVVSRAPGAAALSLLCIVTLAEMASAHDHHEGGVSKIVDGDTVSKEPIVGDGS